MRIILIARTLDKTVNHKGIILFIELIEAHSLGLITEINLWTTTNTLYASPLLVPSNPSMLLIKDSGIYKGIANALIDAGIVEILFVKDDVQACSLLV